MSLCSVSSCMILASFIFHTIAAISSVTSFDYLVLLFTDKSRGGGRVLYMAISTSAAKSILWCAIKDCQVDFFESVPYFS